MTELALPTTENPYSMDTFHEIAKAEGFLSRLQLFSGKSKQVERGIIASGHWGVPVSDDEVIDLGTEVNVLILTWRPKALRMTTDKVFSYFDIKNPEFQKVQVESGESDSGCMFGPEFLVWVPQLSQFLGFYCGSKTARRESNRIVTLLGKAATLRSKVIESGKYVWLGPVVIPFSGPLSPLPTEDALKQEYEKFLHPKDTEIEAVAPGAATAERAR